MAEVPDQFSSNESELPTGSGFAGEDFLFHLYRGSELLQDNCIDEAKEELERALAMQPRDIEGQGLLGVVYFRLGLYPRAIQIYEELIRTYPLEMTPRVNLALCYLKTGQSAAARDVLEEVTRAVPSHQRAWGYLGLAHERLGALDRAREAFEHAGQKQSVRRLEHQRAPGTAGVSEPRAEDSPALSSEPRKAEAVAVASAPQAPRISLAGRFGPAVPALPESLLPAANQSVRPEDRTRAGAPIVESPREPDATAKLPAPADSSVLQFPDSESRITDQGLAVVQVRQSFVARVSAVFALLPEKAHFKSSRVQRRTRGRALDEPLGGLSGPLVLLEGRGRLVLAPPASRRLFVQTLANGFVYVREHQLAGFDGSIKHENGRLSLGTREHVPMVQLSGSGTWLVELGGPLHAIPSYSERPLAVALDRVVGWTGRLLASALAPEQAPGGAPGFVGFSGDGAVLVELAT